MGAGSVLRSAKRRRRRSLAGSSKSGDSPRRLRRAAALGLFLACGVATGEEGNDESADGRELGAGDAGESQPAFTDRRDILSLPKRIASDLNERLDVPRPEHGADVNAATAAVGWTPLHLAALLSAQKHEYGPDVQEIVQTLIDRGANVNARTRLGGWTPTDLADVGDADGHIGLGRTDAATAVLAALQAVGGKDGGCNGVPHMPFYFGGDLYRLWPAEFAGSAGRDATNGGGCEHDMPLIVPSASYTLGWNKEAPGSFTAAGADERLVFEDAGIFDSDYVRLLSLRGRQGDVRSVMAWDSYMRYEGLCFDAETGAHGGVHAPLPGQLLP